MNKIKARIISIRRTLQSSEGFTLIELMIVITIIALMAGFAVTKYSGIVDNAKVTTVKNNFGIFEMALDRYYLSNGSYPSTEEGLQKLLDEGLIKKKAGALLDPWKNPYQYRYPGEESQDPEIFSFGSDGREGGEGNAADIKNWE